MNLGEHNSTANNMGLAAFVEVTCTYCQGVAAESITYS